MQFIKGQEKLGEVICYIGLMIQLLIMAVGFGEWNLPYQGRFMQVAFVLFCVKIILTYYSKKEWLALFILGTISMLSYLVGGDEYALYVVVMIFAAKNMDLQRVCKWILWVTLAATVITAVLSLCGVGGIAVDIRDYGRGGIESRWCLGFGHANNFHGTVWYLSALFIFLFFEKLNLCHYVAFTLLNIIVFCFTRSKGGLIAMQFVIVAACLLCYVQYLKKQTWVYVCGFLSLLGVFTISIISVTIEWTRSSLLLFLDKIFTGRINLAYQHANISMWKLISCAGEYGAPVDNGWVTIFFDYGYVIGIAFVLFHFYLIFRTYKEKNAVLMVLIVSCIFYTFMEATYTVNSAYLLSNISYIAAMFLMAVKKEQENEQEQLKG